MKQTLRFSEIAQIGAGQSAPQESSAFKGEGNPFIRAGSLDSLCAGEPFDFLERINDESAKKYRMELYPTGTVVFAKSGMSATKDRIFVLPEPAYVVSHLSTIRLDLNKANPLFIRYFWEKYRPSRLIKDESYPSISAEDIKNVEILLPSLSEQQHIAAILQKADRLRRLRRYARRLSDTYLQSVFLEMFGDPALNHFGWEIEVLGELIKGFEAGVNYLPISEGEKASDWRVLKISSVTWGEFDPSESKPISPDIKFNETIVVKRGDLLMSRANTTELVGAVSLVNNRPPKVLLPDKLWRIRFNDSSRLLPEYTLHYLRQKSLRKIIGDLATGSSGSMKNISMEKAKTLPIMIPPIQTQLEFAKKVSMFGSIQRKQIEANRQAEHLFQALLQRAFQGEL